MKYASLILSIIALLGVGYLSFKGGNTKKAGSKIISSADIAKGTAVPSVQFAYVDLDSLEENLDDFKKKKKEFEAQEKNISESLQRSMSSLQSQAIELDKKAQAGQVNEAQYKQTMLSLQNQQKQLEEKRQNDGAAFLKKQDDFNKDMQDNLRGFLTEYANENNIDFVITYNKGAAMNTLYANPEYEITADVIKALNSGKKYNTKDTKSKKEEKVEKTDTAKAEAKK